MLRAPLTSASIVPCAGQITVSWRGRVHSRPHWWHVDAGAGWVHGHDSPSGAFSLGGEDGRELCPARVEDRLVKPGLGGGHVREERPGLVRVRLRRRAAGHAGHVEFFEGDHVAGVHEGACGFVVEVAAPVPDLPPLFASWRRIRLRFPDPRRARSLRRCRPAITSAEAARNFGLATISPSEVVRNRATPTSTPTARPVAGSGFGLGVGDDDDVPAPVLAFELQELDRPGDGPVLADLDRADGLEGCPRPPAGRAGVHFAPSPATNPTWLNRR